MVQSLAEFEKSVYNQLFPTVNSHQSIKPNKKRKVSECESSYNYHSAESTIHPNVLSEASPKLSSQPCLSNVTSYKNFLANENWNIYNGKNKDSAFTFCQHDIQGSKPITSNFETNQNEGNFNKKLYKPVPLPSLNKVSAQLYSH